LAVAGWRSRRLRRSPGYEIYRRLGRSKDWTQTVAGTLSDTELQPILARARQGNGEAWGELYRLYAPAIQRFCRHALGNVEDAEDATGDIFIKLRNKLEQYDPSRPFSPWLYKVAGNHCWDLLRQRGRRGFEAGAVEEMPLPASDPSQLERMISSQTSEQMRTALKKIPERARMVLVLRYYSDLSYDEIAQTLELPRSYVGVVLLRARQQLRAALQPDALEAYE
jgi:RNA polymerase sigma-70 factor (ECF subfamily)